MREWHQPREEHGARAVAGQQAVPVLQRGARDGQTLDEAARAEAVGEQRSDEVASGRGEHGEREAHRALVDGEPGEEERDLARDRDASALRHHEQ